MKQSVRKFIGGLLTISTALGLSGIGLVSSALAAGQLSLASATLGSVVQGVTTDHTISFKNKSTVAVHSVKFQYVVEPSGGDVDPSNFTSTSGAKGAISILGGTDDAGNWTLDNTTDGTLVYTATADKTPASGEVWSFQTTNVSNNTTIIEESHPLCDAIANSETCYIRISTLAAGGGVIDQSTISYTVMDSITVTATVDPILEFTVEPVTNTAITGNDANSIGGVETNYTTVSSSATAIQFGNIRVGKPTIGQQGLRVKTNANNGYDVYHKFISVTGGGATGQQMMLGTYTLNNIDAFTGNAGTGTFANPVAFAVPDDTKVTANTNTGWLGIRTSDTDVSNMASANVYAPPVFNNTTALGANDVMTSTGPDNGSDGKRIWITYKIAANAYQPSDQYTGTMVYNVVAKY